MNADTNKCFTETPVAADTQRVSFGVWLEMTKPRLSLMSVISALFGYFCASAPKDLATLFALLVGTACTAGGAAVLNQWMEREQDALMKRTRERPLPAGLITPTEAFIFGTLLCLLGLGVLALWTNLLATLLIVLTLALYLAVYTPLKQITPLNTHIGAIPGALPPLVGYVTAEGQLGTMGWVLFGVLFAWQLPHFMAISWMHREDYAQGGFKMLSRYDPQGRSVALQSLVFACVLGTIAMFPVVYAGANAFYWVPALVLNIVLLQLAWNFYRKEHKLTAARRLFFFTLIYLPIYLAALVAGLRF